MKNLDANKLAFAVVALAVVVGVILGKIPPESMTVILAWLFPSPVSSGQAKPPKDPPPSLSSTETQ